MVRISNKRGVKRAMTENEFMNRIASGQVDILQQFLRLLDDLGIAYCVIGGLAVNAYAEPVVSLDLDLVVVADALERLKDAATTHFTIRELPHSVNLKSPRSDLRVQLQTDPRYQNFISSASGKSVLGYQMQVASLQDVLQGKLWAYSDKERRMSKRQKDLADIFRLVETHPHLVDLLPKTIKALM